MVTNLVNIIKLVTRRYHTKPFMDLYQRTTGHHMPEEYFLKIRKKYPNIDCLSHDRLQCTLQILEKFGVTAIDAYDNVHVFIMNPITLDNYGEILRECGFIKIMPNHIIKYHTLVKSRTIYQLKKENLLPNDINLEKLLHGYFQDWPESQKSFHNFPEDNTSILKVRMIVLEKYLNWKLLVTSEEFNKYCRNYLPLKHKPMSDIQQALDIAQNDIKFDSATIRKNGFIISSDPINTKLILENVKELAGLDIRDAIRIEPAILKNNYNSLLKIKSLLEEFRISEGPQRKCLRVYCMCPKTVQGRLEDLRNLKEYRVLRTNPRVLWLVVHKKKMIDRLSKIHSAKKQCYSLNHLVASSDIFNNYINSFGSKVCGRDLATLILSSLQIDESESTNVEKKNHIVKQLKRHKFWLHAALDVIDENIQFLKRQFDDPVIFNNCQLLLYPVSDVEWYINLFLSKRRDKIQANATSSEAPHDAGYSNLRYEALDDHQILSLVLYEIEKKYHFSGDGIWARQDGVKIESS